jgi:hypothetical protein
VSDKRNLLGFDIVRVAISANGLDDAREDFDLGRDLVLEPRDARAETRADAIVVEDGVPGIEGVMSEGVLFGLVAGSPVPLPWSATFLFCQRSM